MSNIVKELFSNTRNQQNKESIFESSQNKTMSFEKFLENIIITPSISNISQLYQKYREEAEKVDLTDALNVVSLQMKESDEPTEMPMKDILACFSLRIELPNNNHGNSENSKDNYILLNYVNGDRAGDVIETLNDHKTVCEEIRKEVVKDPKAKQYVIESSYTSQVVLSQERANPLLKDQRVSASRQDTEQLHNNKQTKQDQDFKHALLKPVTVGNLEQYSIISAFLNSMAEKTLDHSSDLSKARWGFCAMDRDPKNDSYLTHFFVGSTKKETFSKDNEIKPEIIEKAYELSVRVKNTHIRNLMWFVKRETVKSAVSAIMSRNMSHNLGSHYLYYTKNQLAALADKFDKEGPQIRGAANVLGYVQARMDYLSTIVAGDKYPYGGVFFKGQIFDELTIDDFSIRHFEKNEKDEAGRNKMFKRTTNYLLQNLILSENFTRGPVIDGQESLLKDGNKLIKLQIRYNDGGNDIIFTGDPGKNEDKEKQMFSKMSIALPGGIMSVHAFFNVVENLIRNAAKYKKSDLKNELLVTISVKKVPKKDNKPYLYEFVIYDNKENALTADGGITLLDQMNNQLKGLQVLDEKNALEKSSKGIKEMLFSTLWMRAYSYEKEESLADILTDIDYKKGEDKFNEIRTHAFEYVAVDDKGNVVANNDTVMENRFPKANLGIRFQLPEFRMMELVEKDNLTGDLIEKGLNNLTDIICVHEEPTDEMKKCFTRIYYDESKVVNKENENEASNAAKALKYVLDERFGSIDEYKLIIGGKGEDGYEMPNFKPQSKGLFFRTHLGNNMNEDLTTMNKYYYSDSISGGDFTKTIENLFHKGLDRNGCYLSEEDEYFGLKIKESALTRITLIDERFFKNMNEIPNRDKILSFKNIRLLNLKANCPFEGNAAESLFDGNCFRDGKDCTHFLSIHLGMIEKIVGDDEWSKALRIDEDVEEQINEKIKKIIKDDDGDIIKNRKIRAVKLMYRLREMFKTEKGEVFVSVHSGRGNFSKDLEGPLKEYPFISVSALESVLNDSKFLLAQLLYNTVYIGKGVLNN